MFAKWFVLPLFLAVAVVGCGSSEPTTWPPRMKDPAGDLGRLQGKWKKEPLTADSPETYVIFKGNLMTIDYVGLRAQGSTLKFEYFHFALDTSKDPKRLTMFERKKEDHWELIGGPEWNKRYKLERDMLTLWTSYSEDGEQPYYRYTRVAK